MGVPICSFSCGVPVLCPKGGEHDTDGEGIEWVNDCAHCYGTGKEHTDDLVMTEKVCKRCKGDGKGGAGMSATCSKCGASAISIAMWNAP